MRCEPRKPAAPLISTRMKRITFLELDRNCTGSALAVSGASIAPRRLLKKQRLPRHIERDIFYCGTISALSTTTLLHLAYPLQT